MRLAAELRPDPLEELADTALSQNYIVGLGWRKGGDGKGQSGKVGEGRGKEGGNGCGILNPFPIVKSLVRVRCLQL